MSEKDKHWEAIGIIFELMTRIFLLGCCYRFVVAVETIADKIGGHP